jgi:hypothetical protein
MRFVRDRHRSTRPAALLAVSLTAFALSGAPALAADDQTATALSNAPALVYGQTASLTATVTNTTNPATIPTGSVQFSIDDVASGPAVALASGAATFNTPVLPAGAHTVRATYLPGAGFAPNAGAVKTMTVAKATTSTVLSITPDQTGVAGQELSVSLVVTPTTSTPSKPSGIVSIALNGTPLFGVQLINGSAGSAMELPAMSATITAGYQGDGNYAPSQGITSLTVSKAGTVMALSASPNPAQVNQPVTFAVTLNSVDISNWWPVGTITGTIDGAPVPGSITLDGSGLGSGRFGATFPAAGVHHVVAHFAGDTNFLDTQAALDETVQGPPTTVVPVVRPVAARGLSLALAPRRDRKAPYKFTASGVLRLPAGVDQAESCSGKITIQAKLKTKKVATKTVSLTSACRFKAALTVRRKGAISMTAAFAGNARISAATSRAVSVRAG